MIKENKGTKIKDAFLLQNFNAFKYVFPLFWIK